MIRHAFVVAGPHGAAAAHAVVGGLPNLLRQTLSLQDAGIEAITLVGVAGALVGRDPRVRLAVREGDLQHDFPDGAGGAALVAAADCLWHPGVVQRLVRMPVAAGGILAVGPPGAAVYLCDAAAVSAAVRSLAAGETPAGAAQIRDPGFVVPVRTDEERGVALRLLLRSLSKPADGFVSRHLHRRLSRAVTGLLLDAPVTPNHMTLAAAAIGAAGVAAAWRGGYWWLLAGAVLFELQNVLDGCDGEIARLKHLRSRAGEWLDQIVDDVLNIAFLVAVGMGLSEGQPGHWAWRVARIALAAQAVHLAGLYAGLVFKAGGRGSVATLRWWVGKGTETDTASRFLGDLTRRDFYSLLYVAAAALAIPALAFVWHALITVASAVVSTVQWIAWNGPAYQPDADGAGASAVEAGAQRSARRSR